MTAIASPGFALKAAEETVRVILKVSLSCSKIWSSITEIGEQNVVPAIASALVVSALYGV